tara:strand:+ start:158 stop:559 length:402 start_codon:yes stop_codon:yes gene_type:complete
LAKATSDLKQKTNIPPTNKRNISLYLIYIRGGHSYYYNLHIRVIGTTNLFFGHDQGSGGTVCQKGSIRSSHSTVGLDESGLQLSQTFDSRVTSYSIISLSEHTAVNKNKKHKSEEIHTMNTKEEEKDEKMFRR